LHLKQLTINADRYVFYLFRYQDAHTISFMTIFIILLIGTLLYELYRNKKLKHLVIKKKSEVILEKNDIITKKNEIINHKNDQLKILREEKEWLLKEVHHRVKNNLHTVICLLESQAAYLESDALSAIEKSQNRIYAMSQIHKKLYQSADLQTIEMSVYIPELVQYLKDSFHVSDQIYFNYELEKISLDASLAIPISLIINEALTNSIKYAFPDKMRGEILISLYKLGNQNILELSDTGVGMKEDLHHPDVGAMGIELMKGLTKEIDGEISFDTTSGLKIKVTFGQSALNVIDQANPDNVS
jgi:two-component sensor histidine kinase